MSSRLLQIAALLDELGRSNGGGGATAVERRGRGQVFTPPGLADAVCRLVIGPETRTVLDPAAGDGAFLRAARRLAPTATLVGLERDATVARTCRRRVADAKIHVAEALLGAPRLAKVSAVVGNPPFVRSIRLREADPTLWAALRGAMHATSHGEWDLYGGFLERSLDWLAPEGRVALIVPSRWLTARWAAPLRGYLATRGAMRAVIDLGETQLFAGVLTYPSIVEMAAAATTAPMRLVRKVDGAWRDDAVDVGALGEAPWRPAMPATARRSGGSSTARTLGEVAVIAKGTGTNADGVFVLPAARVRGRWLESGEVTIEAAAARPCWRGRDVGAAATAWCIVPYVDGALLPWASLRVRWPRTAAYLESQRPRLEARERGRFVGDRFHAYGRPQNLRFLLDATPKLIVPDVVRAPRAWIDDTGGMVLDSAYALRPRPDAPARWRRIEALHALMTSPELTAWLIHASVPLRGDYRRIKTAYLAPMPLP